MFHEQYAKVNEDNTPVYTFLFYTYAGDFERSPIASIKIVDRKRVIEGHIAKLDDEQQGFLYRVTRDVDALCAEIDSNTKEYFQGASGCLPMSEHGQMIFRCDISELSEDCFA